MVKRLISASPKDILSMDSRELLEAIKLSEGRVIIVGARPRGPNLVDGVSNAEVAAAFGADLVLVDRYDLKNPYVPGLPSKKSKGAEDEALGKVQISLGRGWTLKEVRELIGRPVGVLLEAVPEEVSEYTKKELPGWRATRDNAKLALELGADFIWVGGGVDELIVKGVREVHAAVRDKLIVGAAKPHGAGLWSLPGEFGRELIREKWIEECVEAGADMIDIPAPGTFMGWTVEHASKMVDAVHRCGALADAGFHTSQEGSDSETIRRLAIYAKMTGADTYSLGDSGFTESMVPPENIMTLSMAIRGRRHTIRRVAFSVLR